MAPTWIRIQTHDHFDDATRFSEWNTPQYPLHIILCILPTVDCEWHQGTLDGTITSFIRLLCTSRQPLTLAVWLGWGKGFKGHKTHHNHFVVYSRDWAVKILCQEDNKRTLLFLFSRSLSLRSPSLRNSLSLYPPVNSIIQNDWLNRETLARHWSEANDHHPEEGRNM